MDRNSIIGFVLIFAILIGYTWYTAPTAEEQAKVKKAQDSIAAIDKKKEEVAKAAAIAAKADSAKVTNVPDSLKAKQDSASFGSFAGLMSGTEQLFTLENEKLKVTLSNKGGIVKAVQLKEYKTAAGKPVVLDQNSKFSLNFFANKNALRTEGFYFTPTKTANGVVYTAQTTSGASLVFEYDLPKDSYLLNFKVKTNNLASVIDPNQTSINVDWQSTLTKQEKDAKKENEQTTLYYRLEKGGVESLSLTSDEKEAPDAPVKWISFKQQFFSTTLIAEKAFDKPLEVSVVPLESDRILKTMSAKMALPLSAAPNQGWNMQYYFGPNSYNVLKQYNLDLEDQIPLGSFSLFSWINKYLVIPVFKFLDSFNLNYGIVILLLTILVKLLLFPLTYRAYLSTAKMRILKPDIDEAAAKVPKEDALARQQITMDIYRKAGVSPLGGCLPQLLQLPFLLALFSFFPAAIELRQESFLWAKDLSTYDSVLDLPFNIPFYGNHVSLFTLLMTASTLLFTWINSRYTATDQQFAQFKWIMYLMPLIFLGILNSYPAGLSYYYFISTMLSIGIQEGMRRFVDEKALHAKIQENRKNPKVQKKSSFQQRLEDMAKKQGYDPKQLNKPKKK